MQDNGNPSTGPEHYKKAQVLLDRVREHGYGDSEYTSDLLAAAQVHATLALAAATALPDKANAYTPESRQAWYDAAGQS
jgi:hypothetical protein